MYANKVYENRHILGKAGEFMEQGDTKRRINSRSKQNLLIVPAPSACELHLTITTYKTVSGVTAGPVIGTSVREYISYISRTQADSHPPVNALASRRRTTQKDRRGD